MIESRQILDLLKLNLTETQILPVDIDNLRDCPALNTLPDNIQSAISQQASYMTFKAGTPMFDCGTNCEMLPLVLSGSIRVFKRSDTAREISLYRVNKNQLCIVTISCLLGGDTYPASGVTETDISMITIPRHLFLKLIAEQAQFRENVFNLFSERLSGLMQLVNEVSFKKLDFRLAAFLVQHNPVIESSHQDIADELGSVREIISRLLKQFEDDKWVKLSRKKIEIINLQALTNFADEVR